MSIGRTFKEALRKGLRSPETKRFGLGGDGQDKVLDLALRTRAEYVKFLHQAPNDGELAPQNDELLKQSSKQNEAVLKMMKDLAQKLDMRDMADKSGEALAKLAAPKVPIRDKSGRIVRIESADI